MIYPNLGLKTMNICKVLEVQAMCAIHFFTSKMLIVLVAGPFAPCLALASIMEQCSFAIRVLSSDHIHWQMTI